MNPSPNHRIALATNLQSSAANFENLSPRTPTGQSSSEHEYHVYEPVDAEDVNPIMFSRHHSLHEPKTTILKQLIETENNYVRALKIILTQFRDPLSGRKDFQSIFSHIEYFHKLHSSFHACMLEKAGFNDNKAEIASCFLKFRDDFTRYGCYCVTLFEDQSMFENSKDELLEQCQREAGYKLKDLLLLPVQRILKYPFLLTQIIEKTATTANSTHANQLILADLRRAHDMMVDLCHHLNEIKRDTDTVKIITQFEQQLTGLTGPQLTEYGRLLMDGKVKLKVDDNSNDPHKHNDLKRFVIVFDKVIIICQITKPWFGWYVREILNLKEYELCTKPNDHTTTTNHNNNTITTSTTRDKWSHSFNLIRLSDGTKYHISTKTAELRNKWVNSIQEAKSYLRHHLNHEFIKCNFDVTSHCDYCKKILHGMFFQGYRCQLCSIAVHKECIAIRKSCKSAVNAMESPQTSPDGEMYVNFKLAYYPWFCGRMGREEAQSILENTPDGTFLVRVSPKHNCSYVISLQHSSKVNHMRIFVSKDNRLYLSEIRYFKNVSELVTWYQANSLVESFQMLDARLEYPIRRKQ